MFKKYSFEVARDEAVEMQEKIKSSEAKTYAEAGLLVEKDKIKKDAMNGSVSENYIDEHETINNNLKNGARSEGDFESFEKIQAIENILTEALNSEKTLSIIRELPEELRSDMIGILCQYLILNRNSFDLNDLLLKNIKEIVLLKKTSQYDFEKKFIDFLVKDFTIKLAADDLMSESLEEQIFSYFKENYLSNGFLYHSFNGVFEESIRENGIDPDIRQWDWNEMNEIRDIFSRVGKSSVFGWVDCNCKGKISIADNFGNVYRYAIASPEWFAQFVAEGMHMSESAGCDKQVYYKRDYEGARRNIQNLIERLNRNGEEDIKNGKAYRNLTLEEQVKILNFFEKYWKILANEKSLPKMALIKREDFGGTWESIKSFADYKKRNANIFGGEENISINMCIEGMFDHIYNDVQIERKIKPESIRIVSFPEYDKIYG